MLYIAILLSLVFSASSTNILLPLYVYPGPNAGNWTAVSKSVAAYPQVQWQIIVNPHSGPGTNDSSPYPNADYITGIRALNKFSNVQMLGYVDTAWGNRAMKDIYTDIDSYAVWKKYSKEGDINIDGVFFDDVPSFYDFNDNPGTDASNETYFRNITSYAVATLSPNPTPIVCNPGNPSDTGLFQFCDAMVEYESTYSAFSSKTITSLTKDGAKFNQTAVVMYSAPSDLSQSTLNDTLHILRTNNVQLVGLTNDCCYNALNETLLTMLAAACNVDSNAIANSFSSISIPVVTTVSFLLLALFSIDWWS